MCSERDDSWWPQLCNLTADISCEVNRLEWVLGECPNMSLHTVHILRAWDRFAIVLCNMRIVFTVCEAIIMIQLVPAKNTYGVCGHGEGERERKVV